MTTHDDDAPRSSLRSALLQPGRQVLITQTPELEEVGQAAQSPQSRMRRQPCQCPASRSQSSTCPRGSRIGAALPHGGLSPGGVSPEGHGQSWASSLPKRSYRSACSGPTQRFAMRRFICGRARWSGRIGCMALRHRATSQRFFPALQWSTRRSRRRPTWLVVSRLPGVFRCASCSAPLYCCTV